MSLLDPKWKYTHSTATDIRKTFARVRRELARKAHGRPVAPKLKLVGEQSPSDRGSRERVLATPAGR
jgi:hypothetical protein